MSKKTIIRFVALITILCPTAAWAQIRPATCNVLIQLKGFKGDLGIIDTFETDGRERRTIRSVALNQEQFATFGIEYVFGDAYSKRKPTLVRLTLTLGKQTVTDPFEATQSPQGFFPGTLTKASR